MVIEIILFNFYVEIYLTWADVYQRRVLAVTKLQIMK